MIDFHLLIATCPIDHKAGVTLRIGIDRDESVLVFFISTLQGFKIVQFLRS